MFSQLFDHRMEWLFTDYLIYNLRVSLEMPRAKYKRFTIGHQMAVMTQKRLHFYIYQIATFRQFYDTLNIFQIYFNG